MNGERKADLYQRTFAELDSLLAGVDDALTAMATSAALLHANLPAASWTGFYRVVGPELLRIGPYQGAIGCLEIPFDRGVCGAAARLRRTQVVPDVDAFPGHIACDSASRSEIVVPIEDSTGRLVAVLDVDSHQPAAFDEIDAQGLERIAFRLRACLGQNVTLWGEWSE